MAMNASHTISGIVSRNSGPLCGSPAPNRRSMPARKAAGPATKSPNIAIGRGTRPDLYMR
jgi:hypothetical protein